MHETPEPVNPYASPLTETPAVPRDSLPQGPFGLAQPLRGSGVILPRDVRRAVRAVYGVRPGSNAVYLALLGLFGIVMMLNADSLPSLVRIATIVCVLAPLFAFVCVNRIATTRQMIRAKCRDKRRWEMAFCEDTVSVSSATSEGTTAWTGYSQCTCSKQVVLLHSPLFSEAVVVPRSFFADQDDWDTLVRLVKHKLPQKQARPTADLEATGPDGATATTALESSPQDGLPIHGQGTLTWNDMREVWPHISGSRVIEKLTLVACVWIALMWLPSVAAWAVNEGYDLFSVSLAAGISLLLLLVCVALPRRELAKRNREGEKAVLSYAVTLSEQRVSTATALSSGSTVWSEYISHRELEHYVLLYLDRRRSAVVLPQSFFSEADWQRVGELVRRRVPKCQ